MTKRAKPDADEEDPDTRTVERIMDRYNMCGPRALALEKEFTAALCRARKQGEVAGYRAAMKDWGTRRKP